VVEGGKGSKKAKAPKHTPEEIAAKALVVEAFVEAFESAKGVKPDLGHDADHTAAFALAKKFGAGEAVEIVRRAMTDTWVLDHAPTLRHIASKPDAWRGKASTPLVKGRPAPQTANGPRSAWED
jgi:hypothetical protein